MVRYLLILLTGFVFSQNSFSASLASSVDRYKISEDETLNLTVTLDDASFSGSPDLAGLDSNFQVLNSSSGSSTTIINGSYTSKKEWHYTLLPTKTGKLLIPSFKLKNLFSDAIEIEVIPAGSAGKNNNLNGGSDTENHSDLYIEEKIDKPEAYVQEEIVLTIRIYAAVDISQPEIPDPVIPDFMVEKLGDAVYQSKQNNRLYYVLEYKYGLFANKNGKMALPKQRYKINQIINSGPRSLFDIQGFGLSAAQPRFLSTPELTLNIKPQPDNLPASYWLPSENITITDNWPEQQTVDVGTPLTRAIEIKGLGNLAAHIPPLPVLNVNGLKTYAEQPELHNARVGDHFQGTRKENIAIVPTQAGTYILPAITLHWWDTKNKQFKTATLPERTLTVKGNAAVAPSSPVQGSTVSPQPLQENPAAPADSSLNSPMTENAAPTTPFYMNVYVWMGTAAFFAVLWLVTLVVLLGRKNNNASVTLSAAESARQQSLRDAFKQLKAACTANDAKLARTALIHWAQLQWPDAELSTLQQVKKQINNDQFTKLADELDGALYRDAALWSGKPLLDLIQSTKFSDPSDKSEVKLPGLYSST